MTDAENREPDWQASLEHHEDLCSERYETIHKDIQSMKPWLKIRINTLENKEPPKPAPACRKQGAAHNPGQP